MVLPEHEPRCHAGKYGQGASDLDDAYTVPRFSASGARTDPTRTPDHARLEELQFLAESGESAAGGARRMGFSEETLERWCDRQGGEVAELWRSLTARNPGAVDG